MAPSPAWRTHHKGVEVVGAAREQQPCCQPIGQQQFADAAEIRDGEICPHHVAAGGDQGHFVEAQPALELNVW